MPHTYRRKTWDSLHQRWHYDYHHAAHGGAPANPEQPQAPPSDLPGVWYARALAVEDSPLGAGVLLRQTGPGTPVTVRSRRALDTARHATAGMDPQAWLASIHAAAQQEFPRLAPAQAVRAALLRRGYDALLFHDAQGEAWAVALETQQVHAQAAMQKSKIDAPALAPPAPTPTPERLAAHEARYADHVAHLQKQGHLPAQGWKEHVSRRVHETVAPARVYVRATPHTMLHVLDSGRVKSQFETGNSSGHYIPHVRAAEEHAMFSYPHDMPSHQRPIYGYLHEAEHGSLGEHSAWNGLAMYGDVALRMHPRTHQRTTFTGYDSLGNRLAPASLARPHDAWQSVQFEHADPAWFSGTRHPEHVPTRQLGGSYYSEAHIHHGVDIQDIDRVILPHWMHPDNHDQLHPTERDEIREMHEMLKQHGLQHEYTQSPYEHRAIKKSLGLRPIAQSGPNRFLMLGFGDRAQVLDARRGVHFPEHNVHSILARGYWQPVTDDPHAMQRHYQEPS